MTAPLVDDEHRQRIAEALDTTLFVEAAAGTGKTTELVNRVVNLVVSGRVEMREIAAITFTEKAAAELRHRVRLRLGERLAEAPGPDGAERARRALGQIDEAALCTLHAFAQRMLAEHPLEAGMPPRIEVLDDIAAAADFDATWQRFLGRLLDEAPDELRTALALGLDLRHLRDLALAFRADWDRLEDGHFRPTTPPAVDTRPVVEALREARAARATCTADDDRLARHVDDLAGFTDRLAETDEALPALVVLADAPKLASGRGRAENWGGADGKARVVDALARAQEAADRLLSEARRHAVSLLAQRVRDFTLEQAARRRRTGRLDFQDLLVEARRLLRDDPATRRRLSARWRRVLVDEFQDTDPLQIEIAVLLASDGDAALGWQHLDVEPGRLFMVGDPKQSIYRFRRADIELYQQVRSRFAAGHTALTTNFRCAGPVVEWVNHVLSSLMAADPPDLQAEYAPLLAHRDSKAPSVTFLGEAASENVGAVREREAVDVAAALRRIRDDGWPVHDEPTGGLRRARFGDVAVLLPTRANLARLERALSDAGVPYRIESRSLVWSTQEVLDLLNVLRAVDDPADEIALVAALRTPALGCRDSDLLRFRRAGGRWSYLTERPGELGDDDPVVRALASLRAFHERRDWTPLHRLVEEMVRELRLSELQAFHARPRDHWRRLRFVLDQARDFYERGGATLRGFVDWAEQQADEQVRVNESILPEVDDDAVRILTVHAAKGLEFPVTVLAGLNSSPPERFPAALFAPHGETPVVEVRLGTKTAEFATAGYADRRRRDRSAELAEQTRLLYVAATRARDHLVVSLHHKASSNCHAAAVTAACAPSESLWTGPPTISAPVDAASDAPVAAPPARDEFERRHARLRAEAAAPVVAATAVDGRAHADEPDDGPDDPRPSRSPGEPDASDLSDVAEPWRRGRAGTSLGRAVHAVLQVADLSGGSDLAGLCEAQADAEGIHDRADDVRRLVRAALDAPVVGEAAASGRVWREVGVGGEVDGVVVEGFVDLLFEREDGLVVVDYKTDAQDSGAGAPQLEPRYRRQGAAYALALESALGRPVTEVVFVFVSRGRPDEVRIDDLASAKDEVRQLLRARSAARAGR